MEKLIKINENEIEKLSALAVCIWKAAYLALLGKRQVEYMLKKYQSIEAFQTQIKEGYEYYFIVYNDTVVGYVGFIAEEKAIFLSKLYLKKEFHGHGLARFVLNYLCDEAKARRLEKIYLTVNKGNLRAIRAYEKFGFIKTDDILTDIGNGFYMDDYVYSLNVQ